MAIKGATTLFQVWCVVESAEKCSAPLFQQLNSPGQFEPAIGLRNKKYANVPSGSHAALQINLGIVKPLTFRLAMYAMRQEGVRMSALDFIVFCIVMVTTAVTVSVCNYFTDQVMSALESFLWNFACAIATALVFIIVPLLSTSQIDLPPDSGALISNEGLTIMTVSVGSLAGFGLAWLIGVTFRRFGWRL
jgi:hypothetical protein